jgi:hypothetical protein
MAPRALFVGAPALGWWPKKTRQWRFFGIELACSTALCVVMICAFHYV